MHGFKVSLKGCRRGFEDCRILMVTEASGNKLYLTKSLLEYFSVFIANFVR